MSKVVRCNEISLKNCPLVCDYFILRYILFLNFEYTNYILNILNFVPFSEVKTDFKKKIFALIKSLFYKRTFAIKNRKQCPFFIVSQILKIKNELSPFFI